MKVEGSSNMSGMGFNTSTRKEDLSTRLKTHNIKRAKDETKKLETESRKMEEKLRELRLAMSKEKEDRERRGGGYWSRGQTGNLNNYATDVLNKPVRSSKDSSGKKKVKVLKDTPVELPERPSQPGTMAFIAKQGDHPTPRQTKIKGPKCGQCEERKAAVSCFQCSELYCPGCFASFHLKGALKKHRSIPISAIGPRQCMSPQPSSRDINDSQILSVDDSSVHSSIASVQKSRNGPEGASVSYDGGPSLLDGNYDERENAAAFQEALMAWRSGGQPQQQQQSPQKAPTPRRSYTPVKTPTVHMDMGTGTMDTKPDVEIKFNTSNLSYAERLMLKKHRRTELDKVNTPRLGDGDSMMSTPRIEYQPFSTSPQQFDRMNTMELTQRERVDFHALYQAVTQAKAPEMGHFDAGDMIITEMDHSPVNYQYEEEEPDNLMIEEVGEIQAWSVESESIPPSTRVRPAKVQNKKPPEESRPIRMSSAKESRGTPSVLDEINMNIRESVSRSKSARKRSKDTNDNLDCSRRFDQDYPDNEITKAVKSIKSRPPSAPKSRQESFVNSRPQSSAKSRPKSSARPGSRAWEDARPSSRFSRASSRMQGEGLLTKSPSEDLQKVAMMSHSIMDGVYTSALSNFLMLGVDPAEELQEERTLTPTKHKKEKEQKDEKYKVSNKLYQMAPRSWRPSSSLAESVPGDQVEPFTREEVSRLSNYNDDQVEPFNREETASVLSFVQHEQDVRDTPTPTGYSRQTPTPRNYSRETPTPTSKRISSRNSARQPPVPESEDMLPELPKTPLHFRTITPKPSSPIGSVTPRPTSRSRSVRSSSQMGPGTPRPSSRATPRLTSRTMSSLNDEDGRTSRAIVVDGEDLSRYDEVGKSDLQNQDDTETLDNLEWELASETGRLTADGKLSRISVIEDGDDGNSTDRSVDSRAFSRMSQQDQGYDINSRLREDELVDDMEEGDTQEEEVRALD